jgi:hypothetical protein
MHPAIVDQWNPCDTLRNFHAVELNTSDTATHAASILDRYFIARDRIPPAAVVEHDFIARPRHRQSGIDYDRISVHAKSENGFEVGKVQPARRTGVPGPAATADVRRDRIDIGELVH